MVNSTFDPSIHLTVQDLQVDVEVNPSSLCMCIESSQNDLFPQGCFTHGPPLTRSRLSSFIQSVLQGAGIPGSFRIGAATAPAQCGIPDHLIKTMGGWTSDAY